MYDVGHIRAVFDFRSIDFWNWNSTRTSTFKPWLYGVGKIRGSFIREPLRIGTAIDSLRTRAHGNCIPRHLHFPNTSYLTPCLAVFRWPRFGENSPMFDFERVGQQT